VRFGHRPVVMVGSIIATIGMVTSAFAVNIYYLYFSFGLLTGKVRDVIMTSNNPCSMRGV
jgi:hypothetical protein